jgi:hypothetical protein
MNVMINFSKANQNKWDGQSKAKVLGFKIFVFILNTRLD